MKFKIHSNVTGASPDFDSFIGEDYAFADEIISNYWKNPSIKVSYGRNDYRYYEYYKEMDRIILFVDTNNKVLDVFCHKLVDWD